MPFDDSMSAPVSWNVDLFYKTENSRKYGLIVKKVCKENKIHFIDLFENFDVKLLHDGVHPNSEGHKKIFEIVRDFLVKNKII